VRLRARPESLAAHAAENGPPAGDAQLGGQRANDECHLFLIDHSKGTPSTGAR